MRLLVGGVEPGLAVSHVESMFPGGLLQMGRVTKDGGPRPRDRTLPSCLAPEALSL